MIDTASTVAAMLLPYYYRTLLSQAHQEGMMWDIVIVGARCAGAATALHFARSGRSVLILDKTDLASDTLSTHVLVPPAIAQLKEVGLLDAVCATGAPPVHTFLVEFNGN